MLYICLHNLSLPVMTFNDSASLYTYLQSHADARKAAFAQKLIPDCAHEILGWPIPELRKLARQLARKEGDRVWTLTASSNCHEMILLRGFIIGYAPWPWEKWSKAVTDFVPAITDWAICDMVCCSLTFIRKHRAAGWDLLRPYWTSREEFHQRFAVVMLMDHYLTDEYIDRVLEVLQSLKPNGYYAVMAVGWALQSAFVKDPDKVLPLLSSPDIVSESRQMARKKILESLRTPPEWHQWVKALNVQ